MEQSLLIIKPDAVKRGLIGKVLTRFEERGFKIVASKIVEKASSDILSVHYAEHVGRDYYDNLEKSMQAGSIFVFIVRGPTGTVGVIRTMLGKTNPLESTPGTIRGDFALHKMDNVCHASDSVESAQRESLIWFSGDNVAF